jgi:hypothetical protein
MIFAKWSKNTKNSQNISKNKKTCHLGGNPEKKQKMLENKTKSKNGSPLLVGRSQSVGRTACSNGRCHQTISVDAIDRYRAEPDLQTKLCCFVAYVRTWCLSRFETHVMCNPIPLLSTFSPCLRCFNARPAGTGGVPGNAPCSPCPVSMWELAAVSSAHGLRHTWLTPP